MLRPSALLIDRGADVNASGNNDRTALHLAAEGGRLAVAERLIAEGADVNARDDTEVHLTGGWTPLHVATAHGHAELAAQAGGGRGRSAGRVARRFAGAVHSCFATASIRPGGGR